MNDSLRKALLDTAHERIAGDDPSHDLGHALRVLSSAEHIAREEGADLDVVVPAALFHDLVVYPKDHPNRHASQEESAAAARDVLQRTDGYPQEKVQLVEVCVRECSFSKGIVPELLESKVLQDADGLEATGAISIMRTYSSTGQMRRPFYHADDPFCENREPDSLRYALDLFYTRLLKVGERMHTASARRIAERRTAFLRQFLEELRLELQGD